MFVSNIIREFYNIISGERVLVLVHSDIDAICSGKILQSLFRSDHILYTLCPVTTTDELVTTVQNHKSKVSSIILINCGGSLDLSEELQLPSTVTVFVADTHRPLHVCNIYSKDQICILSKLEDDEEVPAFNDVFKDDSSSDSDSDEEDDGGRAERLEKRLEKQREKRLWDQNRTKMLFDYAQFSYSSGSSAYLMFELAWKLSKDNNELLWLAIVSLCGEGVVGQREQHKLTLGAASLNTHVARLNHANSAPPSDRLTDSQQQQEQQQGHTDAIAFQKDVQLSLYRHWSVVESLKHTPYTATALKLWTHKGEKRMFELLAELGLPLTECRQLFCGMDVSLRSQLPQLLEGKASKYGLDQLVTLSFCRAQQMHLARTSARDYAHAALALLEPPDTDTTKSAAFLAASDSLAGSSLFQTGVTAAKKQLEAVYSQMQTFLDMSQVISAGPFLYATVLQGSPLSQYFSGPHVVGVLGRFTLSAHVSVSRNKKARSLPLVLTTPDTADPDTWCLVCGIPPVADHSHRNFFGKAFEQAVQKTQSRAQLHFFDTHVIRLNVDDRSKFFDGLITLLS